jgi:hypothetical protein
MQHLKSISGQGHLFIRHRAIGDATYRIDVWQTDDGVTLGTGRLHAARNVLDQVSRATEARLQTQGGSRLRIGVTHLPAVADVAAIRIVGPIPSA